MKDPDISGITFKAHFKEKISGNFYCENVINT